MITVRVGTGLALRAMPEDLRKGLEEAFEKDPAIKKSYYDGLWLAVYGALCKGPYSKLLRDKFFAYYQEIEDLAEG